MFKISPLFEAKKQRALAHSSDPDDELTGRNVGSGWGKIGGAAIGNVPGMVLGHVVGSELGKNTKYDNTSPFHRIGALIDRKASAANVSTTALGSLGGMAAGAKIADELDTDPTTGAAIGLTVGALPGIAMTARSGYKTAKKMGYGMLGRIGGAVSPLSGIFTPKKEKELQRKTDKDYED